MQFRTKAASSFAATVLLLTAGALPAGASPAQLLSEPSASAPALGVGVATPDPVGKQVLVAQGDGWSIYADASSVGLIRISQVKVAGSVTPMTVRNCGVATCSVYLSRAQTRSMNTNIYAYGGGIAGLAASCGLLATFTGPAAPYVVVACAAEISIYGGFLLNAVSRAAGDNGCLRIRYGALPLAFYDDHSSYCRNT
jgi:hypothetical protein